MPRVPSSGRAASPPGHGPSAPPPGPAGAAELSRRHRAGGRKTCASWPAPRAASGPAQGPERAARRSAGRTGLGQRRPPLRTYFVERAGAAGERADATAPRNKRLGGHRGRRTTQPRSRSSASTPSRAAASADGTPSSAGSGPEHVVVARGHRVRRRADGTGGLGSASMDSNELRRRAGSFGDVAQAYAEYRPGYPEQAVALAGRQEAREGAGARARGPASSRGVWSA